MCSVICLVLLSSVLFVVKAQHFDYSPYTQKRWSIDNPQCGGVRQSPIDIATRATTPAIIRPLKLIGFNDILPYPMKMLNNGHTVDISAPDGDSVSPYVAGGPLKGFYQLQTLHFHWGSTDYTGSEHTMSGQRHALELHLVHRNVKYSAEEATNYEDGMLVMALLFQASQYDNEYLHPIIQNLNQVRNFNTSSPILTPFSVRKLMAGVNAGKYYTYHGSLTTPPCSEVVTWIVFADILKISSNQLNEFRQLRKADGEKIMKNHRLVQPLNERPVYVRAGSKYYQYNE